MATQARTSHVFVSLTECDEKFPATWDGSTWNGWIVPTFDDETAAKVAAYLRDTHGLADEEQSGLTWELAEGSRVVNPHTGGIETVDERGDRVCEKHDMWLDPTEDGCGECYVESRGGFRR